MNVKQKKIQIYLKHYNKTSNRQEFILSVLKDYPKMSPNSAQRRWYDCEKISNNKKPIRDIIVSKKILDGQYSDDTKQYVGGEKLLRVQDMLRYKIKLSREYLNKYGYNNNEINYLIDKKIITLENELQNNNTGNKETEI